MGIGKRIKELRAERGWSQRKLGELTEINKTLIANYELGKANPTVRGLIRLTRVFNVTADYILFGKADETTIADKELFEFVKQIDMFSIRNKQLTKDLMQAVIALEDKNK